MRPMPLDLRLDPLPIALEVRLKSLRSTGIGLFVNPWQAVEHHDSSHCKILIDMLCERIQHALF